MIDYRNESEFWSIVEDCLCLGILDVDDGMRMDREEARRRCDDLRHEIAVRPELIAIYHAEPLDVACDLAGLSRNVIATSETNKAILAKYAELLHNRGMSTQDPKTPIE